MKNFLVSLLLTASLAHMAQVNVSSSLTACYAFNGNATDAISALNGTVNSVALVAGHTALANSAYQFSGTASSYIELPDSPLLKSTTGVSGAFWVKVNSFIADDHIIFTRNNASSSFAAYSLITTATGGIYRFRTYKENGTTNYAESTTTITLNTWYHVAFTIDNVSLKIYVNGVLENTTPSTLNFDYQAGKGIILGGCNDPGYNTPFDGAIDNLRFYNRVITAAEVSNLYTNDPACVETTVGIDHFTAIKGLLVYPNPSDGKFILESSKPGVTSYKVLNLLGALVLEGSVNANGSTVDLSSFPNGIYFLRSKSGTTEQTTRIVKE